MRIVVPYAEQGFSEEWNVEHLVSDVKYVRPFDISVLAAYDEGLSVLAFDRCSVKRVRAVAEFYEWARRRASESLGVGMLYVCFPCARALEGVTWRRVQRAAVATCATFEEVVRVFCDFHVPVMRELLEVCRLSDFSYGDSGLMFVIKSRSRDSALQCVSRLMVSFNCNLLSVYASCVRGYTGSPLSCIQFLNVVFRGSVSLYCSVSLLDELCRELVSAMQRTSVRDITGDARGQRMFQLMWTLDDSLAFLVVRACLS
jgi:hypothetical protein